MKLELFSFDKDYGEEDGALCGVFDGHGKNGHIVSKLVNNRLPKLILSQKNAVAHHHNFRKNFHIWKEACIGAFKVMDKEIKLQENLDCSCSGTTAVVVIRQVKISTSCEQIISMINAFW